MTRYDKRLRAFAVCLSALAGYVDATGFLLSGGFFVSFMSGNSTRLGVGISAVGHAAVTAAYLVLSFVCGVALGSLVGDRAGRHRRSRVLLLVSVLLGAAALASLPGWAVPALVLLALAMGAENAVFGGDGGAPIGLTYITGSLVRVGQGFADLLRGRRNWTWIVYLLLWAGLVTGAVAGAASYVRVGSGALWIAFGFSAVLTCLSVLIGPEA